MESSFSSVWRENTQRKVDIFDYLYFILVNLILTSNMSVSLTLGSKSGGRGNSSGTTSTSSSATLSANLATLFDCPVCFDYLLPPILHCQSGHLVCSSCHPKLACCPICKGPLGNIRCLAMENVVSTVTFPCRYSTTGCSATLLHTEKMDHEEVCEFRPRDFPCHYSSTGCSATLLHTEKRDHEEACEIRPYSCPFPLASCKWQGALEAVMPHIMSSHKSIATNRGEDFVFTATDIGLPCATNWVMMQSCFGHHFMMVLEKREKFYGQHQFFATLLLIGSPRQAEGFAYQLELNRQERCLLWRSKTRSIPEGVYSAFMIKNCLVIETSVAELFADNGDLRINVTISVVL